MPHPTSTPPRKVRVIRVPDPLPGYETVEVPGKGGYIFHDGEGWFDLPVAQLLVDAGVAKLAAESPVISVPSGIVMPGTGDFKKPGPFTDGK